MALAFDDRIVEVSIEFPSGTRTYQSIGTTGLSIYATGQKFDAALSGDAEIRIFNLTQAEQNFIISQTSPLQANRTLIPVLLNVGRKSYGTFTLFRGLIFRSGISQPPDIGVIMSCNVNYTLAGSTISDTHPATTFLSTICANIAANSGYVSNFLATDKQISNYSYNGSLAYHVNQLNNMGGIIAFVDNNVLTVRNKGAATNSVPRVISAATGMVGIPTFTMNGITVTMMIDNSVNIGNIITIQSQQLPAANGNYVVQKIVFDLASRDAQFYYTLICVPSNISTIIGTEG